MATATKLKSVPKTAAAEAVGSVTLPPSPRGLTRTATVLLRGISPMSQSRQHDTPRPDKEPWDKYERRTYLEKAHFDGKGEVYMPPMALKKNLVEGARRIGRKIPGRGSTMYAKFLESGVLCMEPIMLGLHKDELGCDWINADSNGKRGSGSRVKRCFPKIPEGWTGIAKFAVMDDTITEEVFEESLREGGTFIGIGRFRPENGGFYGRFVIDKITWA